MQLRFGLCGLGRGRGAVNLIADIQLSNDTQEIGASDPPSRLALWAQVEDPEHVGHLRSPQTNYSRNLQRQALGLTKRLGLSRSLSLSISLSFSLSLCLSPSLSICLSIPLQKPKCDMHVPAAEYATQADRSRLLTSEPRHLKACFIFTNATSREQSTTLCRWIIAGQRWLPLSEKQNYRHALWSSEAS